MDGTKKCEALRGISVWIVVGITIFVALFAGSAYAEVPISDGFDYPVGIPDHVGYSISGWRFLENEGPKYGNIIHPGEDWNGNGGGDTDYQDPVCAISNGYVVAAGNYGKGWGNIILIEHKLQDGTVVWSQYAHLDKIDVSSGEVQRGQQIGTIGKGYNNEYSAHLHFEVRKKYFSPNAWVTGQNKAQILANYYNPSEFIGSHRPQVVNNAQIVTQSISPTIVSPRSKLTFVFSIKNPNSDSIKNVRLGAQIRTNSPQGTWIDDPSNDKVVTLSPGTKDYSRTFVVPQSASSGYYDARWVILDDKTGTWIDSETMTRIFEVKTQSQPPALTPIGDKSVSEKEKLTFRISAKDPDGDKVTYSAEGLPNGAKLTSSGLFTWTPGSGTAGKYTVKFIATANGQTDSKTITITVNKVADNPPVLASIGDKSVSEQNKLSFTLSAKDPDGDKVTYSAEGLPSGAKLTSSGLFIWTPGSGTAGKYTVKFIATANGQIDYETITITVNNPLSALPEITSITPSKTEAGTFDLTIKGKNFNSKTAVEMVYFNGKYVGQGTIKSRSSTKIVVTEKMTGALPGVYVVKVRNNPSDPATESNGKELTITAVPVTLSISPASGKQGTTFSFTGKGYTPNGKIEWHVKKPDGTEFPVGILTASSSGNLKYTYKSNSGSMIGTYNIWAVDQSTGRVSNQVKERIR